VEQRNRKLFLSYSYLEGDTSG